MITWRGVRAAEVGAVVDVQAFQVLDAPADVGGLELHYPALPVGGGT